MSREKFIRRQCSTYNGYLIHHLLLFNHNFTYIVTSPFLCFNHRLQNVGLCSTETLSREGYQLCHVCSNRGRYVNEMLMFREFSLVADDTNI